VLLYGAFGSSAVQIHSTRWPDVVLDRARPVARPRTRTHRVRPGGDDTFLVDRKGRSIAKMNPNRVAANPDRMAGIVNLLAVPIKGLRGDAAASPNALEVWMHVSPDGKTDGRVLSPELRAGCSRCRNVGISFESWRGGWIEHGWLVIRRASFSPHAS
jgi:hypothetical protein